MLGFKSFAEKSSIEFTEGITALLGPNGCGKSNVVDAVKWVLGEQSTKALRGGKMEDVIFNGTEGRKPLNVAEVTMTIANENGILDMDMAEVAIKRRLYRTGESEYYINNMPARLKEIREIFYDTGIGKSAYSVMEQGKIDQVLSNKPEERRHIFEEAAGITKYKARGAEAERKLEKTKENMAQVENIISEVKRSYDTLSRQSEKTLEYRRFKEEVFQHELAMNLQRRKNYQEKLAKRREEEKALEEGYRKLKEEIGSLSGELESHMDQMNTMENQLIEGQKQPYGIDLEKENFESRKKMLKEKQEEIQGRLEEYRARQKKLEKKHQELEETARQKEEQLAQGRKELEEVAAHIQSFEERIEGAGASIEENSREMERNDETRGEREGDIETLQNDLREITDDIVTQLDAGLKESGYSWKERKEKEETLNSRLESLRILVQGRKDLLGDAGNIDSVSREELVRLLTEAGGVFGDTAGELGQIQEDLRGYIASTPTFLDEFLAPEGIITRKRQIDQKLEEARADIQKLRTRNQELTAENKALSGKIEEYRATLEELRVNQGRKETQMTALEESVQHTRGEMEENSRQMEELSQSLKEGEEQNREAEAQQKKLAEEWDALIKKEEALKADQAELEKSISRRSEEVSGREKNLQKLREKDQQEQLKRERIQMEIRQLEQDSKNLAENFLDRYSRDLEEYDLPEEDRNLGDIKAELNKAKEGLRRLGQVNLMAPEEFSEVKERYDFLHGQLEDLSRAREDLERVTKEIQTESVQLFMKTYQEIKKNFHTMFRRLFGGGRAEIKLLDPEDVLNSGIEILGQPPGKKLESIALLSGGERSLTAVGLLFATYQVKPSPFCILDEIDAALDEQNVQRFVNVLLEFGERSQFIVITHNKKTVAGAETLLGVTMEESGISKLISLRMNGEKVEDHAVEEEVRS